MQKNVKKFAFYIFFTTERWWTYLTFSPLIKNKYKKTPDKK